MQRAKSCGKDAQRKSQKPTFPLCLEIPQTPRDSHFPTASAAAVYMTNSDRTDGDISNDFNQGTFLMHYDTEKWPLDNPFTEAQNPTH